MEDLEKLSDSELRHRLLQYGFPNMPVTETTRKILIRKLRNHLNNEKSKINRQTSYVTRYSSDEETEQSPKPTRGRSAVLSSFRNTSQTSQVKMPPPTSPVVLGRRSTNSGAANSSASFMRNRTQASSNYTLTPSPNTQAKQKTSPKIYVPPPILASESEEDNDYLSYSPKQYKTTTPNSSYTSPYLTSPNNFTLDRTQNYSLNMSSNSPSQTAQHTSPSSSANCNGDGSGVDFRGDFTQRLLKLRGETIRDSILQKRPISGSATKQPLRQIHTASAPVDASEIVYQQAERVDNNISPSMAFSQLISRLDEQYGFKQTFIPGALVCTLLLFFVLVGFVYMTIRPDLISTIDEKNTVYAFCDPQTVDSAIATASYSCIERNQLQSAILLLKNLLLELQRRAEQHFCKDASDDLAISAKDFVKLLHKRELATDLRRTLKDLHNAEYLISQNPQWKISHVDPNTKEVLDLNDVIRLRPIQGNSFAILNPRLPITCTISNKIQQFFLIIGTFTLIAAIGLTIHIVYRFIQNRRKNRAATIEYYTSEVIAELMRKAINPDPLQSTVVVNHLRDKLIPLHKRKEKTSAWNEVIRNLELHDSRIQFDLSLRNGEECKTMKWIANISADMLARSSNSLKQWHSPAFDKSNKIANPPTNCLKIRQMFEPIEANNPNLKTIIQDAILEKVGPKCKIYDIQLDKQSCCVYVRCATERDAGIVHNEINGWWFDKRLVSIKFLRLQRYLSRFPKSASGPLCLQPSNSNNSSMTQCNKDFGNVVNGVDDDEDDDDEDDEMDEDEN